MSSNYRHAGLQSIGKKLRGKESHYMEAKSQDVLRSLCKYSGYCQKLNCFEDHVSFFIKLSSVFRPTHPMMLNHILEVPNKTQRQMFLPFGQLCHVQGEMAKDMEIVKWDRVHGLPWSPSRNSSFFSLSWFPYRRMAHSKMTRNWVAHTSSYLARCLTAVMKLMCNK